MNKQLRNSIVALVCSVVVGALLFWPWGGTATGVQDGPEIHERERSVWLVAIHLGRQPEAEGSEIVVRPRTGAPYGYREAIGELVLSLGGLKIERAPEDSFLVAAEEFDRTREAVDDFARKNSRRREIGDWIQDIPGIRCARKADMEAIEDPEEDRWEQFRDRFPEGRQLMTFSRVGFSSDGVVAVVYWSSGSPSRSGGGLLVLKEISGKWKLIGVYGGWNS